MPDQALTFRQADALYQSFPDFSAWPVPTDDDLRLWDRFASRLREMREKATPESLRAAVEVAVRAAAVDTGAIEGLYTVDRGFTMTVATQAVAWEQAMEEKGREVRELFEAQLAAYELVLDAVTRKLPITEAWIRALHEKVCAGQKTYRVLTDQGSQEQELPRGAYKTHPNHVRLADGSLHPYSPVDRVAAEMHRLLEQVRSSAFESAHPVAQASYVHYGLVVIHPFADGNGRVARALASVFFYRAHSIPFLVFANQRTTYFEGLHRTDLGNPRPLLAFFRDRGIDTAQLVVDHLLTAGAPDPEAVVSRMRLMDDTARRLLATVQELLRAHVEELQLPDSLRFWVNRGPERRPKQDRLRFPEYRLPREGDSGFYAGITDSTTTCSALVRILITSQESNPFPFLLDVENSDDKLEIRLEDAYPEISESLKLRLVNWCHRLLGRLLKEWHESL